MALLRTPLSVFISLTYRCNFKCRHCAVYSDDGPTTDLDTDSWLALFHELAELKVFRVRLSGGEPFMRGDIWELLDAIDRLPIRFSVNTNASLIDDQAATRLKRYGKLDEIMVSLDGSCPEIHDRQRGPGTFQKVSRGLGHLAANDLPISMYCTVTKHNFSDLRRITEKALGWGAFRMKFNYLLPEGRALNNYRELALTKQEWQETLERLKALQSEHGDLVCGTILDLGRIFDGMKALSKNQAVSTPSAYLSGCGALTRECAVRPDGWITPCDRMPDACAGHIRERRFGEIWRSSQLFTQFRQRNRIRMSDLEECRDCVYQSQCTGGCPAVPHTLYGNFNTRDPLVCYRIYSGEEAFHVQ